MTAAQLSKEVADYMVGAGYDGVTKQTVNDFLNALSDVVQDELTNSENTNNSGVTSVPVLHFGRFKLRQTPARPARRGRNPATGEEITIAAKPAGKRASVTFNKEFKQSVGIN